jgi:hypothetical protein
MFLPPHSGTRTGGLGHARDDVVVARKIHGQVRLEARAPVVAPQAALVRRLPGAVWPRRRARRGHVVGGHVQRRGDAIGDAQQLAMGLCNRDLGRRPPVGRRRVGRERRGWPFARPEGRLLDVPHALLVVAEREQRAAFGGAARRDGRGGAAGGVVGREGRREARRSLRYWVHSGPHYVGHGGAGVHSRVAGSSCSHCDSGLAFALGVVKAKRDG